MSEELKRILQKNLQSLFENDDYGFDEMEVAFDKNKNDNLTDAEKAQFDDMEDADKKLKPNYKPGSVDVQPALNKVNKETGKDATDYYKDTAKKMKDYQKPNQEAVQSKIGEAFEPKKFDPDTDDIPMGEVEPTGTGMEGLRYDNDQTENYEEMEERMDDLNGGDGEDTTYGRMKKAGKEYRDYKYGDKYDEVEDEYQETPRVRVKESVISEAINEDMGGFIKSKVIPKIKEAGIQILPLISGEMSKEAVEKVKGFENGSAISYENLSGNYSNRVTIIMNMSKKDVLNDIIKHFGITNGYTSVKQNKWGDNVGGVDGKNIAKLNANHGDIIFDLEPHNQYGVWTVRLFTVNKEETTKENKVIMKYSDVIEENIFKTKGNIVSEEQVIKVANKIPSRIKIDETVFAITDGENYYRLIWEGSEEDGEAIITHQKNGNTVNESVEKMKHLWNFDASDKESIKKNVAEGNDDVFKKMLDKMRNSKTITEATNTKNIEAALQRLSVYKGKPIGNTVIADFSTPDGGDGSNITVITKNGNKILQLDTNNNVWYNASNTVTPKSQDPEKWKSDIGLLRSISRDLTGSDEPKGIDLNN